ncbi:MAG: acyl transferase [Chitinophagaceae bacterium]|nr:acyl transferase [Chitinophagaceae bacterium]MCA6451538.1 acyl transferase [Chitinophagaceae bacterium]MCA6455693.1 acyl transferase [Chitinophagaceae bacterium]MCA6459464.1 acyl transferase [Chitinophagaceae bacterium]MCA6464732.1 acyl transferase [Chitinophagaceae bacterium]
MQTFHCQYQENPVYREWCQLTGADPAKCKTLVSIPSLPISFFKSREVVSGQFQPEVVFESSGTTQQLTSRHLVKELALYRRSFLEAFCLFYGKVTEWCVLGLLPSYLERQHSSLVMMVDELIRASGHPDSGFYLYDHQQLSDVLQQQETKGQKTLLIGVTFALLDFAASHPQQLIHTVVMETGGMKGRRKELTRTEVHRLLTEGLGVTSVHSEYGMTELLSQAYSTGEGRFVCPPWMKVLVRDEEDPFVVKETGRGILQVIDLANRYSVSFIATEDVGQVFEDGSFEVWGRLDNSDIRGCSQLVV